MDNNNHQPVIKNDNPQPVHHWQPQPPTPTNEPPPQPLPRMASRPGEARGRARALFPAAGLHTWWASGGAHLQGTDMVKHGMIAVKHG